MTGHHKFSNLTKDFSAQRKTKIAAKKSQLCEEMALYELRQALKISQAELAEKLQVKQPAISRLEKRTDMYVSHLRQVIQAMGGELEIVARFRDGEVKIKNFSEFDS
ncbi:putative transcriptional regulator with C-terminal CBS domains [Rivularia sp. PCC 7116]|uniref:XRE family transcriptional regulator n=1 Tax=Rivularia sp. PCC 7116 TaxID=373994 RepID=UPI00029F2500|nr:XRE family transcriptional regulator [Rivularia sp. PCC 7116]AFY54701.1 putative transcriptional regulator with C-terminal CBS domains [Rivularia sp. PCC 7116]